MSCCLRLQGYLKSYGKEWISGLYYYGDFMYFFSHCPICRCSQSEPVESCRRCGAHLLLLAKVRLSAHTWQQNGHTAAAHALYRPSKRETDE